MSKKIKIIIACIVAVIIIAAATLAAVRYLAMQKKLGLSYISIEDIAETSQGLEIKIFTVPQEGISGIAEVSIINTSLNVNYTVLANIMNGKGATVVPYNEFVVGNGKYVINAVFNNKSAERPYIIDWVIEDLTILMDKRLETAAKRPQILINIPVSIPLAKPWLLANISVAVDILDNDGNIFNNYLNCSLNYSTATHQYQGVFNYQWSGNYSARATLINRILAETSLYRAVIKSSPKNLINLAPIAVPRPENQTTSISQADGWAYFYGGNSTDYDDDDEDLTFKWFFDTDHDDTQTNETNMNDTREGKDVSYQYMGNDWRDDEPPLWSADHYVALEVLDRWGRAGYKYTGEIIENVAGCKVIVEY